MAECVLSVRRWRSTRARNGKQIGTKTKKNEKPPELFHFLRRLASADSRRALDTLASVTQAVGRNLYKAEEPGLRGEKREMVTRRSVKKVGDEFRRAIGPDRYVSS